jgi:hypothetical protein
MPRVKFVNLYLLSQHERRALKVPLNWQRLIIQGGNGFGKSAIIKSLYETLGATPQKIDDRWKRAGVSSCLEFDFDGRRYVVVKMLGLHALFDGNGRLLFTGARLVKDWGPRLAAFFGFKLEMTDHDGEVITPPPSYMFAPFYVDQDTGWSKAWTSFADFYLKESTKTLADYHSGLRPDAYYSSKASLAKERLALSGLEGTVRALRDTISQVQKIDDVAGPTYDLAEFASDVEDLIAESKLLYQRQVEYRGSISDLHEEAHLLGSEMAVLQRTLAEMRGEFELAAGLPAEIECPTCGHGYQNNLADRFALIADEQVLREAFARATGKLTQISEREARERGQLVLVEQALDRIRKILDVQRASMSLNDVIIAAGKTEAAKILRRSLDEKIVETEEVRTEIDHQKATMESFLDRTRTAEIMQYFRAGLASFAADLDVQIDDPSKQPITAVRSARGSEGPRELLAYYYAFLRTKILYAGGVEFPLVIDAPNQQGQDAQHLPQMLRFIFDYAPPNSQVIVAIEEVGDDKPKGVQVKTFGEKQRQVLRDDDYDDVELIFAPYARAIIEATRI